MGACMPLQILAQPWGLAVLLAASYRNQQKSSSNKKAAQLSHVIKKSGCRQLGIAVAARQCPQGPRLLSPSISAHSKDTVSLGLHLTMEDACLVTRHAIFPPVIQRGKYFPKRHSRRIPLLPLAQNWVTVSSSCQGAWRGESSAFPAPPVRGGSQEKAVGWVTNKQSPVPGLTPPLSCYLDRLLLPASQSLMKN